MRFSLIALALLSLPAFACPNLTGTYAACRSTTGTTTGSSDVVVTQRVENGVTIYSVTSTDDETGERDTDEFAANGETYTTSEPGPMGTVTTSSSASCAGNVLSLVSEADIEGKPMFTMNMAITGNGSTMTQEITGEVFGQAFQDTVICQ